MTDLSYLKIPEHISVIMDGNSRWAKVRGMDVTVGHSEGASRVKDIVKHCGEIGVKWLSLFAFSTENWDRPSYEINSLMELLVSFLDSQIDELIENNVRLLVSGRKVNFSDNVIMSLENAISKTSMCNGLNLVLCIDYGGRQEIIDAANKKDSFTDEAEFKKALYLSKMPDIDLLIRTSGEERISNYMLWQLSYSELYFTQTLWPDFKREELVSALKSYTIRQRRFGLRI